jgi:ATP-dependent Lhr-like helicase
MADAYRRLHPSLQRHLYDLRWEALREIQELAVHHLLDSRGDCVISAPTAGGKTEAAFLPILSQLATDWDGGVRALYVGPLKALINDQFRRVETLCGRMEIPVHRWHGDVGETERKTLLTRPSGILLITPESLEAMFVLRPTQMPHIFDKLAFVVIDELHSFIGSVRGAQLQSQLFRLKARCGCDPVRVGLSATLGDPVAACSWLRPDGAAATYIEDATFQRGLKIRVKGYLRAPKKSDDDERLDYRLTLRTVAREMLRACGASTNLAFANSKGRIEEFADCIKAEAAEMGLAHEIIVHHGSLSKEEREHAEQRLRAGRPCTAVCSNTLEMGIDIGEVDNVVQLAAPWSVASLVQRVGRSGRRGGDAVLRAYFVEGFLDDQAVFWDGLHLDFLRGVAMIRLMLPPHRFTEPPESRRAHRSTLIHQLLSTLAETGGLSAAALHRRLMDCRAFGELSGAEFARLLRELASHELITQMAQGDLILGPRGEKLRDHFSFYAAFVSADELRVLHGSREIGSLPVTMVPHPEEFVILAGRRWRVESVDVEHREIIVTPGQGGRPPRYNSLGADVHPRVHAEMRNLACGSEQLSILDGTAMQMLEQVRNTASSVGRFCPGILPLPEVERTRLFLWAGSKIQRTLLLALRQLGLKVTDEEVGLDARASGAETHAALQQIATRPPDGIQLARHAQKELQARIGGGEKFDEYVPEDLWVSAFASDRMDINGMVACVQTLISESMA